jgi:hypothetical protein
VESLSQASEDEGFFRPPVGKNVALRAQKTVNTVKQGKHTESANRPTEAANVERPRESAEPSSPAKHPRPATWQPELVLEASPVSGSPKMRLANAFEVRRSPRKKTQQTQAVGIGAGGSKYQKSVVGTRKTHGSSREEPLGSSDNVLGARGKSLSDRERPRQGLEKPVGSRLEHEGGREKFVGGRDKDPGTWRRSIRPALSERVQRGQNRLDQIRKGKVTFIRPQKHDYVRNGSQAVADVIRRMGQVDKRAQAVRGRNEGGGREKSDTDQPSARNGRPNKRPMDSQFLVYGEGRAALGPSKKRKGLSGGMERSELPLEGSGETGGDAFVIDESPGDGVDVRKEGGVTSGGLQWPEDRKRKRGQGLSQESRGKRQGSGREGLGVSRKGERQSSEEGGKEKTGPDRIGVKGAGKRMESSGEGEQFGKLLRKGSRVSDAAAADGSKGRTEKSEDVVPRKRIRRKCFSKYKRVEKEKRSMDRGQKGETVATRSMRLRKGLRVLNRAERDCPGSGAMRVRKGLRVLNRAERGCPGSGATGKPRKSEQERPSGKEGLRSKTRASLRGPPGKLPGHEDHEGATRHGGHEGQGSPSPEVPRVRRVSFQANSPSRRMSSFGTQQAAAAIFEMAGGDVMDDDRAPLSSKRKTTGLGTPRRSSHGGEGLIDEKETLRGSGEGAGKEGRVQKGGTRGKNDGEAEVIDLRGGEGRGRKRGGLGPVLATPLRNPAMSERGAKRRRLSDIGSGGEPLGKCHVAKPKTPYPAAEEADVAPRKQKVTLPAEKIVEKEVSGSSGPLFGGHHFLLTGFPSEKKDKLSAQIVQHGGQVLMDVPAAPSRGANSGAAQPPSPQKQRLRNARGQQEATAVLAETLIRTPKFLFGCAVGAWPVRPRWISACVKAGRLVGKPKYEVPRSGLSGGKYKRDGEGKKGANEVGRGRPRNRGAAKLEEVKVGGEDRVEVQGGPGMSGGVFAGVCLLLHGSASFKKAWALLVKHAGGRICRSVEEGGAHVVVLEKKKDEVPSDLKRAARRGKMPIKVRFSEADETLLTVVILHGSQPLSE